MAVAVTQPSGVQNTVFGNKKVRFKTLTFSGNYATGGEALSASDLGLKAIDIVVPGGPARSTDLATANVVSYNSATGKVVFYESGASGAAIAEKTDGEAYPTGANLRVMAIGR